MKLLPIAYCLLPIAYCPLPIACQGGDIEADEGALGRGEEVRSHNL
ncbi:MAG: hypothetical protein RIB93_26160 [Coleofasciculus sp. D1-CHI-01]